MHSRLFQIELFLPLKKEVDTTTHRTAYQEPKLFLPLKKEVDTTKLHRSWKTAGLFLPLKKEVDTTRLFVFLPFYGYFLAFLFNEKADRGDVNGEIF